MDLSNCGFGVGKRTPETGRADRDCFVDPWTQGIQGPPVGRSPQSVTFIGSRTMGGLPSDASRLRPAVNTELNFV